MLTRLTPVATLIDTKQQSTTTSFGTQVVTFFCDIYATGVMHEQRVIPMPEGLLGKVTSEIKYVCIEQNRKYLQAIQQRLLKLADSQTCREISCCRGPQMLNSNNNTLLRTHGPYHRHKSTKNWLAIHQRILQKRCLHMNNIARSKTRYPHHSCIVIHTQHRNIIQI